MAPTSNEITITIYYFELAQTLIKVHNHRLKNCSILKHFQLNAFACIGFKFHFYTAFRDQCRHISSPNVDVGKVRH